MERKTMNDVLKKTATDARRRDKDDLKINRIVAAVDLSPHSEKTAAYAARFAKSFGAALTLVHVFATKPVRTLNSYETPEEEKRHSGERKLADLVEKIRLT